MRARSSLFLLTALALPVHTADAAEGPDASSGFLTDYSLLAPAATGQLGTYTYVAPTAKDRLATYGAIAIDQPAIAVAPDSKLKGLKPDDVKLVADALRQVLADELATGYRIVDRPAADVLGIRLSLSNVYVQKKGRGLLGYTPVGIVVSGAKSLSQDVLDKVLLTQVAVEFEMIDSETGEVLVAAVDQRGDRTDKKAYASWEEVEAALTVYAKRIKCSLDNARSAPGAVSQDCTAIVVEGTAVETKKKG